MNMDTIETLVFKVRAANARYNEVKRAVEAARIAERRESEAFVQAASARATAEHDLLEKIAEDTP